MHVLVATDGAIDPATTSGFAASLAGPDGRVTVLTVVEVPRTFLRDMRRQWDATDSSGVFPAEDEYVETPAAFRETPQGWPGDDALIGRYLDDKLQRNTGPLVEALADRGTDATALVAESEDVAGTILEQIERLDADVVVIGSHGRGLFQGLIGSNGTKIVRRSPKPVLLIRTPPA